MGSEYENQWQSQLKLLDFDLLKLRSPVILGASAFVGLCTLLWCETRLCITLRLFSLSYNFVHLSCMWLTLGKDGCQENQWSFSSANSALAHNWKDVWQKNPMKLLIGHSGLVTIGKTVHKKIKQSFSLHIQLWSHYFLFWSHLGRRGFGWSLFTVSTSKKVMSFWDELWTIWGAGSLGLSPV